MGIPDYQTIMLPLLKLTTDQNEYQFRTVARDTCQRVLVYRKRKKRLCYRLGRLFF